MDDVNENEAELQNLRLRMRAIEVMFNDTFAASVDPVLRESIDNWKEDWAALRDNISDKKKSRKPRWDGEGDATTITNVSDITGTHSP